MSELSPNTALPPLCAVCGTHTTTQCANCKEIYYCSKNCQKADFKLHKLFCHSGFNIKDAYPPKEAGKTTVRGLFFPQDEVTPRFVEVPFELRDDEDMGVSFEYIKKDMFLGDCFPQHMHVPRNVIREKELKTHTLVIYGREAALVDGSKTNQSVLRATEDQTWHDWSGPFLVVKTQPITSYNYDLPHLDLGIADVRDVVDYFIAYGTYDLNFRFDKYEEGQEKSAKLSSGNAGVSATGESAQEVDKASKTPKADFVANSIIYTNLPTSKPTAGTTAPPNSVPGVMIYCRGDREFYGRPKFVETLIPPAQQSLLMREPTAPILALISLDIKLFKRSKVSHMRNMDWSPENQPATFLNLNPASGWAPFNWQNEVGSTLLMRKDKKNLTIEQVEVLCDFCQFHLQPIFQTWTEKSWKKDGSEQKTRKLLDKEMTRGGFEQYFEKRRLEKVTETKGKSQNFRWKGWISPYDM